MKLSDINVDDAKKYALVFSKSFGESLAELHAIYGSNNCVPVPRQLIDGRLMLSADILTETNPGGLLYSVWEAADKLNLLSSIEVISWEEALSLLPSDPPIF